MVVVDLEYVRPAIDAVPCGVHLPVLPSFSEFLVGESPDPWEMRTLVGPVEY